MEIYTYGNTGAVIGVLHALVMLFGTNDFMDIVRTAIVIGFIVAACAAVMQTTHRGWRWLMTVLVVYSICFIPKTSVLVTDKLGIQPPEAVAGVPWLAGFMFSVKSQIGHTLVRLSETALQTIPTPGYELPAELTFEKHGVAFGNRLIRETRSVGIPDTQLRADVIAYIRNCVYPEVGKSLDATVLSRAIPLWPAMNVANPALVTTYTPPGLTMELHSCPVVYSLITARLPAESVTMLETVASNVSPGVALATAVANIGAAIPAAYTKTQLASAATSVSDLLLHNAMINHFAETGQVMATSASDPAAVLMSLAKAQATAQANASYMLQARMAEEATPVVRNVIEILLLAFFPVVCVMLLVTEGQRTLSFFVGYLYALVWIELWPFTYAILNYVHMTYAAKEIAASAYNDPGNALSLMTSGIVYSTTLSTSAIAGWLTMFVPMLSAALLWGFDKIVGAVPSIASMVGVAGQAGAAAAVGNVSQGNVSMGQQMISPQRSSAWFSSVQDDLRGDNLIYGLGGVSAFSALKNESFVSGMLQAQHAASATEQASKASETAIRESNLASATAAAAWGEMLTKGSGRVSVQDLSKAVGQETAQSDAKQWADITSNARTYAGRWGMTEAQAATVILSARAGIGLKALADTGASVGIDGVNQAHVQRGYDEIRSSISSQQAQETRDFLRRLSTNEQYRTAVTSSQEERDQYSAKLERASTHATSAEASFAERDALLHTAQLAYTRAASLGYDFTKDPRHTELARNLTEGVRHSPTQAQLYLDSELARFHQLARPTGYLDGSSASTDLRKRFEELQGDTRVANDTSAQHAQNRQELGPVHTGRVVPPSNLANADARLADGKSNVDRKHEREQAGYVHRQAQVENRLDRPDGPDGKFRTRSSLTGRAAENALNDTVDTANERVVPLIKKMLPQPKK